MSEIIEPSELELQSVGYAMRHLAWCGVCEDVFAKVQYTNLMPESGETTRAMETERNPSAFALCATLVHETRRRSGQMSPHSDR